MKESCCCLLRRATVARQVRVAAKSHAGWHVAEGPMWQKAPALHLFEPLGIQAHYFSATLHPSLLSTRPSNTFNRAQHQWYRKRL